MLDSEIDRAAIGNRFKQALQSIRTEARDFTEDEIMADVQSAIDETRSARHGA